MTGQTAGSDVCQEAARLVRAGEFAQAIALYREELQRDAENIEAHRGLASASFMVGDYDAAIEHFTQVARLDPRSGSALVNLGAVYNRLGNYEKAVEVLRRGAQLEKCGEAFYNLGIAKRSLGELAMAVSAYREAIQRSPKMVEAYQNLANVYFEMENYQQAIANYKKALELCPEFDRARAGLEAAELAIQKSRGAISPFGRLVGEQPAEAAANRAAGAAALPGGRDLTEQERMERRIELRRLSYVVQSAGHEFDAHLKKRVEPQLVNLIRIVGEGKGAFHLLGEARDEFHAALEEWIVLRAKLQTAIEELRAAD